MKRPLWISGYAPLSCIEGKIESLIVILPPEEETSKIKVYQPLIDGLNASWREVIQFNNDFSQINEFWKDTPETSGKHPTSISNQSSTSGVDPSEYNKNINTSNAKHLENGDSWEETTRTFNPDTDMAYQNSWEETTRYLRNTKPTFSPEELVAIWQREIDAKEKIGRKIGNEITFIYSEWIQDPVFCMQKINKNYRETTMVYSIFQQRLVDFILPLELAQNSELNLRCHPTRLILEGGNMLFVDKVLFIGKNLVRQNLNLLKKREPEGEWNEEKVLTYFKVQFNVEHAVPLGLEETSLSFSTRALSESGFLEHRESHQPFFHLDLYLNFGGLHQKTGKRIAFVGSPTLALELLNGEIVDDGKGGKNSLGHHQGGKNIVNSPIRIEDLTERTKIFFNDLKRQLSREGFTIVEVPLYPFAEPIMQGYAVCSWNNSLVEIYNNGIEKHIYLPSYFVKDRKCRTGHNKRIKLLESEVKRIYENHGFVVHFIDAGRLFRNACQRGGSLHCMVKVLRRKD